MIPLPSLILSVVAPSQERTVTQSVPQASAAHAESYPRRSASCARAMVSSGLVPGGAYPMYMPRRTRCDANAMTIADLRPTDDVQKLRAHVRAFMEEHVYPNEATLNREDEDADALVERLRALAKEHGLWAPHLPPEAGGSNGSFLVYAHLNEEIGRSIWAQLVFGCQAPDAGNLEILHSSERAEQKARWLAPLVGGEIRSFFSMTEPDVPGSDPDDPACRAVRDGDDWVIDGHKWFSSGRGGGLRDRDGRDQSRRTSRTRRASQIIVPADSPGVRDRARGSDHGARGRGWTTTARLATRTCACRSTNPLGEPGDGFRIAQKRLGPRPHPSRACAGSARCERVFELMCRYALRARVVRRHARREADRAELDRRLGRRDPGRRR